MESRPASSVLKSSFPRESPMISPLMLFPFTSTTRSVVSRATAAQGETSATSATVTAERFAWRWRKREPGAAFPYFLFSSSRRAPSTRECHP